MNALQIQPIKFHDRIVRRAILNIVAKYLPTSLTLDRITPTNPPPGDLLAAEMEKFVFRYSDELRRILDSLYADQRRRLMCEPSPPVVIK